MELFIIAQPTPMWDLLKQYTTNERPFTRGKVYTLLVKLSDLSGSPNHQIQDIEIVRKLLGSDQYGKEGISNTFSIVCFYGYVH
jgi:hypothetical protein